MSKTFDQIVRSKAKALVKSAVNNLAEYAVLANGTPQKTDAVIKALTDLTSANSLLAEIGADEANFSGTVFNSKNLLSWVKVSTQRYGLKNFHDKMGTNLDKAHRDLMDLSKKISVKIDNNGRYGVGDKK